MQECYGEVAMACLHGILTNKKFVPATVDVG